MHKILLAAVLAVLSNAASAGTVYYVYLADEASRITSFEIAAHGSDRFHRVLVSSRPLGETGSTVTLAIRFGEGDCRRDLRIGFASGRRIVRRDLDVCRLPSYRPGQELLLATQP